MNEQRRKFLIRTLSAGAGLGASAVLASAWRHALLHALSFEVAERLSDLPPAVSRARFPEKEDLILLTDRPPQLETPLHYFRQDLTPNSAFFVRWHVSGLPTTVDLKTFRLNISGHVKTPLSLSFHKLPARFPAVSMVAVNQCSGNSRSYYSPRVLGGQWKHGAMGNARWAALWNGVTGSAMPAWRDRRPADLRGVLTYVRYLSKTYEPLPSPAVADSSPFDAARTLFAQNRASCHRDHGRGDGPAGAALARAPTDFHVQEPSGDYARRALSEACCGRRSASMHNATVRQRPIERRRPSRTKAMPE